MLSLASIAAESARAAAHAAKRNLQPYVPTLQEAQHLATLPFPEFGEFEPDGWAQVEVLFCDSSGFGEDDEPALSVEQLKAYVLEHAPEGYGYALGDIGQFQVNVKVYRRTTLGDFVEEPPVPHHASPNVHSWSATYWNNPLPPKIVAIVQLLGPKIVVEQALNVASTAGNIDPNVATWAFTLAIDVAIAVRDEGEAGWRREMFAPVTVPEYISTTRESTGEEAPIVRAGDVIASLNLWPSLFSVIVAACGEPPKVEGI
jgi:hypothetical protein